MTQLATSLVTDMSVHPAIYPFLN